MVIEGGFVRKLALSATLLGLLASSVAAVAQWSAVESDKAANGREAMVKSDYDARISIWLDKENILFAQFELASGLIALDEQICPTFQIDLNVINNLTAAEHRCEVSGAQVRFQLTQAQDNTIDSPLLLQFMNGSRVIVRYRLKHAGYGAQTFSLKGSKQALINVFGDDITVKESD